MSDPTCLRDYGHGTCRGEVKVRLSYGGTGTKIRECEFHMDESAARNAEHRRRYPDTDTPPSWFDPADAGEHWNDDY